MNFQLAAKGLNKTDSDIADLYVGYQLSVTQEKEWNAYGGAWVGAWVAAWLRQQVQRFRSELWVSMFTTRLANS